jgi:hypothetical protein
MNHPCVTAREFLPILTEIATVYNCRWSDHLRGNFHQHAPEFKKYDCGG